MRESGGGWNLVGTMFLASSELNNAEKLISRVRNGFTHRPHSPLRRHQGPYTVGYAINLMNMSYSTAPHYGREKNRNMFITL